MGEFHPLLVHFPIVLFTLVLVADILYYLNKPNSFEIGSLMLFFGTLSSLPTAITGWEASKHFAPENHDVWMHFVCAIGLISYALFYCLFRFISSKKNWSIPPVVFLILSFVLVTITSYVSDFGGILSHGKSPFSISLTE